MVESSRFGIGGPEVQSKSIARQQKQSWVHEVGSPEQKEKPQKALISIGRQLGIKWNVIVKEGGIQKMGEEDQRKNKESGEEGLTQVATRKQAGLGRVGTAGRERGLGGVGRGRAAVGRANKGKNTLWRNEDCLTDKEAVGREEAGGRPE
ncbi:hypothetical protein BY996DRAFT_6479510 [Phakopsora pachyrhizi]|nr:hypothetical protein BY996DRAFT_6479510 [Phakopsora pachyrhizi]